MPVHTVFQPAGFETPLATKPAIIVCAMPRITMPCLRYADHADNQCQGNKQYCPIILHEQTLLWTYSRYQKANRALLKAGALAALSVRKVPDADVEENSNRYPQERTCSASETNVR
jgi:hypothetical protein